VGRTAEGFGYVAIYTLVATKSAERRLRSSIVGLFDMPGLIVDLRRNNGGSDPMAARIASMFADLRRVYARSKYPARPRHDDFGEARPRILRPRRGPRYARPIVCLIGPGCGSSGEGLVLALAGSVAGWNAARR
jgi:C-terminal processing protease CtpA/Prc